MHTIRPLSPKRLANAAVVFSLFIFSTPLYAQLSPQEQEIAKYVDQRNEATLKLLEKTVNINSGSMNFRGVREVGQVFKAQLDALGFTTQWVDGKSFGRAGHLVATHVGVGKDGKRMLLIGHLDTVFEPSSPFQRYKLVNDSTAQGPGAGDMKGGDVIMIQAIGALKDAKALDGMNITIVLTGDEEMSGKPLSLSRKDLIEAAKASDVAIGFENADGNPATAVVARRGSTGWVLKTTGQSSHSSQIFKERVGAGAIFEAARIVNQFYNTLSNKRGLTFSPGVFLGGTTVSYDPDAKQGMAFGKNNVVAKEATIAGDVRTLSAEQLAYAQETMQTIVSRNLPKTKAELSFDEGYPPMPPKQGNYRLLRYLSRTSRDLGFGVVEAVNPEDAGAADISFVADLVEMAIDGVGPSGNAGHTVDETIDPRSISMQAKRVAVLMYRLAYANLDEE